MHPFPLLVSLCFLCFLVRFLSIVLQVFALFFFPYLESASTGKSGEDKTTITLQQYIKITLHVLLVMFEFS